MNRETEFVMRRFSLIARGTDNDGTILLTIEVVVERLADDRWGLTADQRIAAKDQVMVLGPHDFAVVQAQEMGLRLLDIEIAEVAHRREYDQRVAEPLARYEEWRQTEHRYS